MPRRYLWFAASLPLVVLVAGPLPAATIVEREVTIDVRDDGIVTERERWVVAIERAEDVAEWSPFSVQLDENRRLVRLAASVVDPGGRSRKVPDRSIDTIDHAGSFELHSSRRLRRVEFPGLMVGGRLVIEWEVEERPWFPAGAISVGTDAAVERLRVEIRGPDGLRWTVVGRPDLLRESGIPGGVAFSAEGLPARSVPDFGLEPSAGGPTILFSWTPDDTWEGVGSWFRELAFPLLGPDPEVRSAADRLAASSSDPREALESLVRFVRRDVRYVAVEVGIGGYRPSPPRETLQRRWGDCKDKSFLLIDLLRARGISAHPVLIRAGDPTPPDTELPSPGWFDHLIVAVPVEGLDVRPEDPVSEGLLFVDPTQTEGSATWLHPGVQGRRALLVTESGSRLVATPMRPALEETRLEVEVVVGPDDRATGRVTRTTSGRKAAALRQGLAELHGDRAADELKAMLERSLPGAIVERPEWTVTELPVPTVVVRSELVIERFLQRSGSGAAVDLPDEPRLPAPRVFDERPDPWILDPALHTREWRLDLRLTGCRAEPSEMGKEALQGGYRSSLSWESDRLVVRRRTEIGAAWLEPWEGPAFRPVALLEHQTAKRRLRLTCAE